MASEGPESWTELKTYIADQMARSDATSLIPQWIAKFEFQANREIFVPDRETSADLTIDAAEEALPAGLQRVISLYLTTDPKTYLEQLSLAELRTRYSDNSTGCPQNYALRGNSLILGPSPDATYTGKLAYVAAISPLNSVTTSNWLLADHPDAYIAGTLYEGYLHFKDERRAMVHLAARDAIIESINRSGIRRAHGGAPLRIRHPAYFP